MKLLTKDIKNKLPKLYSTEGIKTDDKKVICKFFCPWNSWTWYAIEYDGEDTFFGYVVGLENELGYFSLNELKTLKGFMGLSIERDLYYKPKALKEILSN